MKMTSSSLLISLLLLSILVHEAQGIRIGKGSLLSAKQQKFQEDILRISLRRRSCKGGKKYWLCFESSGIFKNSRLQLSSSVRKQTDHHQRHWLPTIHEDYYGPKIHNPRHH